MNSNDPIERIARAVERIDNSLSEIALQMRGGSGQASFAAQMQEIMKAAMRPPAPLPPLPPTK